MTERVIRDNALFSEIHRLVTACLEGSATTATFDLLETLVSDRPEALDLYVEYLRDSISLRCVVSKETRIATVSSATGMRTDASGNPAIFVPQELTAPTFPASLWHGTVNYFSSGWPLAYLIATVIFTAGLLVAAFAYVSQPVQVAVQPSSSTWDTAVVELQPTVVGRITGMVDCRWAHDSVPLLPDDMVLMGRELKLESGLLEIGYDSGARVILQGPVTYEIESKNGGFLSVGKLTGKVTTTTAKGFVVRTPTATMTDLGTEFGVEVTRDGATGTQVFAGRVHVAATGGPGDGKTQQQTLVAGQYAHVGTSRMLAVGETDFERRAELFTRVMPEKPDAGDDYANLVLSMDPVVYYRMEQWPKTDKKGHYVLVDSAPGGHHGAAYLDESLGEPSCRGKFGRALYAHGPMSGDYAIVQDYPKAEAGRLTVSVWVLAFGLDPWTGFVSNWSARTGGQFGFGIDKHCRPAVVIQQSDGKDVQVVDPGQPLRRGQWQHAAFVADGAVLRLYRNGAEVASAPYRGIARPELPKCLGIGCQMDRDGTRPRPGKSFAWIGQIDEVALFNRALGPDEVRRLYTGQAADANGKPNQ